MWPIASDVAHGIVLCLCAYLYVSVCILSTVMSCAETPKPIEVPFELQTHGFKELCIPLYKGRRHFWWRCVGKYRDSILCNMQHRNHSFL